MASRNRYTKLNLGPMTSERHRSVAGSIVIADYVDPTNGQRILVLERAESKPKRKAAPKVVAAPKPAATAFPGSAVTSGS